MTVAPLRIVLVEDHELVRAAVGHALDAVDDLEVVAQVATAEDALTVIPELRPDVALVDIDLPAMRGPELVRELAPRFPDLWLVMLTVSKSERDLFDSIRSGARGYLHKDLSPEALVRSIRDIRRGVMPMSRRGPVTGVPSRMTRPLVGGTTPAMIFSSVDLPQPEGPMTEEKLPSVRVTSTGFRASILPWP